jgi:hypothetical protein
LPLVFAAGLFDIVNRKRGTGRVLGSIPSRRRRLACPAPTPPVKNRKITGIRRR